MPNVIFVEHFHTTLSTRVYVCQSCGDGFLWSEIREHALTHDEHLDAFKIKLNGRPL